MSLERTTVVKLYDGITLRVTYDVDIVLPTGQPLPPDVPRHCAEEASRRLVVIPEVVRAYVEAAGEAAAKYEAKS